MWIEVKGRLINLDTVQEVLATEGSVTLFSAVDRSAMFFSAEEGFDPMQVADIIRRRLVINPGGFDTLEKLSTGTSLARLG